MTLQEGLLRVREKENGFVKASLAHDGYNNAKALTMVDGHCHKEYILDSGYSYRMTPYKDWFT